MRMSWLMAIPALAAAMPAHAQRTELARIENDGPYENDVQGEMQRVSPIARRQCLNDTQPKYERFEQSQAIYAWRRQFDNTLRVTSDAGLVTEEAGLRRRIALAEARGDNRDDMRPNALGDLITSLNSITAERESRAAGRERGSSLSTETERYNRDSERRYYNDALLACLDFRDRFPGRKWCDPNPAPGYARCESEGPKDWDTLPDQGSGEEEHVAPTRRRPPWERESDDPALAPSLDTGIDTTGWSGTYADGNARYRVTGSAGGTISVSYTAIRPGLNQSGSVQCGLVSGRAECKGSGNYEDSDKSIAYDEAWSVTLSGTTISGTWRVIRATPSWRVTPSYTPALHTGATGSFSIEKER